MKCFIFPFEIYFGKSDSIDGSIVVDLSKEQAARLLVSAEEGGRYRLDEDENIRDVYNAVMYAIIKLEKPALLENPEAIRDYFELEDYVDVTEDQVDEFLYDLQIDIYYPLHLQRLKPSRKKEPGQGSCDLV